MKAKVLFLTSSVNFKPRTHLLYISLSANPLRSYDRGMDTYLIIKTLHILSATILFGTGAGIAFFMFCSRYADNIYQKYYAAKFTVIADYIFTLPAVIIQPITGFWLIQQGGFDPMDYWLSTTYILYALAGICWIPVVWIQIQMKKVLALAIENKQEPSEKYHRLFKIWFLLGWPAFGSLIAIFFLMAFKPV